MIYIAKTSKIFVIHIENTNRSKIVLLLPLISDSMDGIKSPGKHFF